jgi:excisionase family DNA binding protein
MRAGTTTPSLQVLTSFAKTIVPCDTLFVREPHEFIMGQVSPLGRRNETTMHGEATIITVSELADYLRVHRSTIYRLLKKSQLPGFKIGGDWRFNLEEIDRWRIKHGVSLDEIPQQEKAETIH